MFASKILGLLTGDVVLTDQEVDGLSANLLVSDRPPTCATRFSEWLAENRKTIGNRYSSEIGRHFK